MALLLGCLALAIVACSPTASSSSDSETVRYTLSDREVVAEVQDWLAVRTYERLVGVHVADRTVDDQFGYKNYNCYNSISIDSSPSWQVQRVSDHYKVTAELSVIWQGHRTLTWDFYPATGLVKSTHDSSYCRS